MYVCMYVCMYVYVHYDHCDSWQNIRGTLTRNDVIHQHYSFMVVHGQYIFRNGGCKTRLQMQKIQKKKNISGDI
jgi:hypothetical protein